MVNILIKPGLLPSCQFVDGLKGCRKTPQSISHELTEIHRLMEVKPNCFDKK